MSHHEKRDNGKPAGSRAERKYVLRLYISGMTMRSRAALENISKILEEDVAETYELEVIDIYQQPEKAKEAELLGAPTLVKELPEPLRRMIGDMSDREKILKALDITELKGK